MFFISYEIACRSCFLRDGVRHIYSVTSSKLDYKDYQNKTEYEVMNLIEKWRFEDNKTCLICGSPNVEILEIKVNEYSLYNFDYLAERDIANNEQMLIICIDKSGANINTQFGGTVERIEKFFLKFSVLKIWNLVNSRPDDDFLCQNEGSFFICLTGRYDHENNEEIIRVEKYRNVGLTREELIDAIKPNKILMS